MLFAQYKILQLTLTKYLPYVALSNMKAKNYKLPKIIVITFTLSDGGNGQSKQIVST